MSFHRHGLDRISISKSVFDSLYFLWRTTRRLLLLSLKMTAKPRSGSMANTITGKTNLQKLTGRREALQCFKYTISLSFVFGNTVQLAKLICKSWGGLFSVSSHYPPLSSSRTKEQQAWPPDPFFCFCNTDTVYKYINMIQYFDNDNNKTIFSVSTASSEYKRAGWPPDLFLRSLIVWLFSVTAEWGYFLLSASFCTIHDSSYFLQTMNWTKIQLKQNR